MKRNGAPDAPQLSQKYCLNCGRLISANHRNFEERKYCSKYCSSNRLDHIDRELERRFIAESMKQGQMSCDDMQAIFLPQPSSQSTSDIEPDPHSVSEGHEATDKQKAGMEAAKWRERVRRAARRVVTQDQAEGKFEAVQKRKVVEPSFAKGDWAVRYLKP